MTKNGPLLKLSLLSCHLISTPASLMMLHITKASFIALNFFGVILVFDPTLNMKVISEISCPLGPLLPYEVGYLVEASGHLLQVQRFMQIGKLDSHTIKHLISDRVLKLQFGKSTMEEARGSIHSCFRMQPWGRGLTDSGGWS